MRKSIYAVVTFALIGLLFGGNAFAIDDLTAKQKAHLNDVGAPSSIASSYQVSLGDLVQQLITGTAPTSNTGQFQTSLYANGRYSPAGTSNAITLISSSTGLGGSSVPYTYIIKDIGGAGVDLTPGSILPDGIGGQEISILISGVGSGTCQWKLTPTHTTGFTSITFTASKQTAVLLFDTTLGWVIKSCGGTINL